MIVKQRVKNEQIKKKIHLFLKIKVFKCQENKFKVV